MIIILAAAWPRIREKRTIYVSVRELFVFVGCSCDGIGSISSLCDPVDGSCMCIDNVAGQDCSSCIPDYWGFNTPEGCARCSCDPTGKYN